MSAVISVDFAQSREAAEQREVRAIVRKIKRDVLTKSERDVLMVMVNLWFYHKGGPKKYINPGRAKIAKKADVCEATARRALKTLRDFGVIHAIAYENGGHRRTHYRVDLMAIRETFNPHGVKAVEGKLVHFTGCNSPVLSGANDPVLDAEKPGHFDPRIIIDARDDQGQDWLSISESLIDYEDDGDA